MGVERLSEVDMKAMSTAQIMPCASGTQKVRGSSPRTPRHSGHLISSSVATAPRGAQAGAQRACVQAAGW